MKVSKILNIIGGVCLISILAYGQNTPRQKVTPISFDEVWHRIREASPIKKSTSSMNASAEIAEQRASRHWLPRLYLDARTYRTNDPAQSFIGLLEQRKLQNSDFDPAAINEPKTEWYTRGALGLDWRIYEGGMASAEAQMRKKMKDAQIFDSSQAEVDLYSQVAKSYSSIGIYENHQDKILNLKDSLERLMKSYQLGLKSNPVGYSGLLGMKSVAKRIEALLNFYDSQTKAHREAIRHLGGELTPTWAPEHKSALEFSRIYFKSKSEKSFRVRAAEEASSVQVEVTNIEKSRFLPRVGAFAEGYNFTGPRNTEDGYSAGLYLQWSLFSPTDYGVIKESKLKALASKYQSEALSQKEQVEIRAIEETLGALEKNIQLLSDSDELMTEQTRVSEKLFREGAMNALQFVEILNRRVDLVVKCN